MKIPKTALVFLALVLYSTSAYSIDLSGSGGSQIPCEDALQEVLDLTDDEYDLVQERLMNRDGITGSIVEACSTPECGGARHGLDDVDACREKILSNSEMKIDELRSFLKVSKSESPKEESAKTDVQSGEEYFKNPTEISSCKKQIATALNISDSETLSSNLDKILKSKEKSDKDLVRNLAHTCSKSFYCPAMLEGKDTKKECKREIERALEYAGKKMSLYDFQDFLEAKYNDCKDKIRIALGVKDLKISDYFFEEKPSDDSSTEDGPGKKTVAACSSSACESVGKNGELKDSKACKELLFNAKGGEREFKIKLSIPVECSTAYHFEDSGAVSVKSDSPDISEQFQETKSVDDDGYIALVALLNVMRDTKSDASGSVIVANQDISLMKKALQRSIDYAKKYESQVSDLAILDTFKRQVSFAEGMLKYIDERADGKFSKEKIDELGAFLEKDKDFHGYYINNPDGELYGICQEYGMVPRCCTANDPEKNNVFATSLCNKNLASGEPNPEVFRYEKSMCKNNKIFINPSKPQNGGQKEGRSLTKPKS